MVVARAVGEMAVVGKVEGVTAAAARVEVG